MKSRLDQIEARLQAFIESSLYFLPGSQRQAAFAHQLVTEIERAVVPESSGNLVAPNHFLIRLNPANHTIWMANPGLIDALSRVLNEAAREVGVNFVSAPVLELAPDSTIPIEQVQVHAATRVNLVDSTAAFPIQEEKASPDTRPTQAFVIIHGNITLPLRLPVVNIGRRPDNQIVVDDPRVSRVHAQLRAVRGHYVLFDLNSTGGTFVNSNRVSQQALKPGDVISLAGFPIIYGEDTFEAKDARRLQQTGRLDSKAGSADKTS
jgi:hypothetical protein